MSDLAEQRLYEEALRAPSYSNLQRAHQALEAKAQTLAPEQVEELLDLVRRIEHIEAIQNGGTTDPGDFLS